MNGWDAEDNARRLIVREADDFLANGWFIEETELALRNLRGHTQAGLSVQTVVIGESVFGEDFKNGQAALAAEILFMRVEPGGQAFIAAVKTMRFGGDGGARRICELFNHNYCAESSLCGVRALTAGCGFLYENWRRSARFGAREGQLNTKAV